MRQRRHSRAGGGRNMCHSGFEQTSHVVGMWKLMATSSWPLWLTCGESESNRNQTLAWKTKGDTRHSNELASALCIQRFVPSVLIIRSFDWHKLEQLWNSPALLAKGTGHRTGWRRCKTRPGQLSICNWNLQPQDRECEDRDGPFRVSPRA